MEYGERFILEGQREVLEECYTRASRYLEHWSNQPMVNLVSIYATISPEWPHGNVCSDGTIRNSVH